LQYPDQLLLFAVLFLVAFGMIMVFSSSSVISLHERADPLYFFRRHVLRVGLGLAFMAALSYMDYKNILRYGPLICGLSILLLFLVLFPGIGVMVQGGRRWLDLGGFRFQPSEVFKLGYVIFMANSLSMISSYPKPLFRLILPHFLLLGVSCGLIVMQPNLSTAILIMAIGLSIIFVVYRNRWLLSVMVASVPLGIGYLIWSAPYRMRRITAFLNPFENQQDSGYQIIQSFVSLGSGGLLGLGLGQSRQKFFYLPEEHTDFIFAVLGEEFGFIGCMIVILSFAVLIYRGLRVAMLVPDYGGKLLAFGIVMYLFFQIMLNLAVVSGIIPPTGVPLPFVSYGGTSLVINLAAVGILLGVSRHVSPEH